MEISLVSVAVVSEEEDAEACSEGNSERTHCVFALVYILACVRGGAKGAMGAEGAKGVTKADENVTKSDDEDVIATSSMAAAESFILRCCVVLCCVVLRYL